MRLSDYFRVSFSNIVRQKLRTSLTIFAVVIGATSVAVMLSLVTGAKSYVSNQFSSNGTLQQVAVSQSADLDYNSARHGGGKQDSTGVKLSDDLVSKISRIPHVAAVTPTESVGSLDALSYKDKKLNLDQATAYVPNGVITHTVLSGRDLNATDGKGAIVLSDTYAKKLGFTGDYSGLIGQQVNLITQGFYTGDGATITQPVMGGPNQPQQSNQSAPNNPTTLSATVVGVVAGNDDNDASVYMSMTWAKLMMTNQHYGTTDADQAAFQKAQQEQQQQMQNPNHRNTPPQPIQPKMSLISESQIDMNGYQAITVKADNTKNVDAVATSIRGLGVGAATAKSFVHQQMNILNIVGLVLGCIGGIALLVASIGVVNTMIMAILERTREIGVMRACGATRAHVRRLFTFEAASLGFWGGVLGLGVAYGLIQVANLALSKQFASSGVKSSDIIGLPLWLIGAVIAATTVIGMLAGLGPASRAARLNPVEALRYE